MIRTNLDKLINLKMVAAFPAAPKEGDIVNHTTGPFIYRSAAWLPLLVTPDLCQIKANSAAITTTTDGVVSFNNLTIGKNYRMESLIQLSQRSGSNVAVSVHAGSAGPFGGVSFQKSNTGASSIVETMNVYRDFVASETTHVFSVLILAAGSGGGTTSVTFFEPKITELNFTKETTDFT